jgi:hypothetical protein
MSIKQPNLSEQLERDELDILNSIESLNSSLKNLDSLSRQSTNESLDMNMVLLKENFYAYDHTIKAMIIGSKSVGKTTFLTSLLTRLNYLADRGVYNAPLTLLKESHKPTMSLEINKRLLKINNQLINLEFWDTNELMFNTPIIKSKIYIKTSLFKDM